MAFRSRAKGVTLIELIAVITVISILALMVVPEFTGTHQFVLLRSNARNIISILNLAYSQAVTQGRVHRVCFDQNSHKCWLESKDDKQGFLPVSSITGSACKIEGKTQIQVHSLGDDNTNETFSSNFNPQHDSLNSSCIYFQPDGTSERREIVLTGVEGLSLALRINPITSRVKIIDLTGRKTQ